MDMKNMGRNIFLSVKEERRNGMDMELHQQKSSVDQILKQFSFSQRTVNEWNRLSADCVGTSSVNMLKNKIDIYLRTTGYTQINRLDSR